MRVSSSVGRTPTPCKSSQPARPGGPAGAFQLLKRPLSSIPLRLRRLPKTLVTRGRSSRAMSAKAATAPGDSQAAGTGAPPAIREAPTGVEDEARILEAFAQVPMITKAWCRPSPQGGVDVHVQRSQRDLASNVSRKFVVTAHVPMGNTREAGQELATSPSFPWELKGVTAMRPSPTGKRMFVARESEGGGAQLEVWGGGRLLVQTKVPHTVHGSVFGDGWFEGISFSADEHRIAYVAERPQLERTPLWGGEEKVGGWRGKGRWEEEWGELFPGKAPPNLFVLDVRTKAVSAVAGVPEDMSTGQVAWAPAAEDGESDTVVFTAWPHGSKNFRTPRRLGIVYCLNRPCALYCLPVPLKPHAGGVEPAAPPPTPLKLTGDIESAMGPRFSPDGRSLVFISHSAAVSTGVHSATGALLMLPWGGSDAEHSRRGVGSGQNTRSAAEATARADTTTVVAVVQRPGPGEFPGLYCTQCGPFLDSRTVLVGTPWRSSEAVLAVDTDTGAVQRVSPWGGGGTAGGEASYALLDAAGGVVVAAHSTPGSPPRLVFARVPQAPVAAAAPPWAWEAVRGSVEPFAVEVEAALKSIKHQVIQVAPGGDPSTATPPQEDPFECILMTREDTPDAAPVVMIPHGGPHSGLLTSWVMSHAFLCALGYNVLQVNYRGSTGFGERPLQSLPGNIGRLDVADCLAALDKAAEMGLVDSSRVAVVGGSHGGFLAAHLIGQAPDRFAAGVLRNPVCNIAAMVGMTDIPDWCFVEACGSGEGRARFTSTPSKEDYADLLARSPVTYIDNIKAPALFLLGAKDLRVPYADGLQMVHGMRERGQVAEAIVFPEDSHPLSNPQTEFESWVNIAAWLRQHMGGL